MPDALKLYTDRYLPLYPADGLRLHPIPTVVDLCALRLSWEHHSYGGVTFGAPRMRPTVARVRPPSGSDLPQLIAITRLEYTGYERVKRQVSADFGEIVDVDRYYRYETVHFDPEIGTPRTPFLRLRGDGAGILYAHGLERQHMTWYQRNADTWYANQGVLVIGFNTAALQQPLMRTIYPDVSLPEFDFYNHYDPPLPASPEIPALMPAPAPLPSGTWRFEFAHGAAIYNEGHYDPPFRPGQTIDGSVRIEALIMASADAPLSAINGSVPSTRKSQELVRERGASGSVEAREYSWDVPLDFGS